jgi:hypothetical protein
MSERIIEGKGFAVQPEDGSRVVFFRTRTKGVVQNGSRVFSPPDGSTATPITVSFRINEPLYNQYLTFEDKKNLVSTKNGNFYADILEINGKTVTPTTLLTEEFVASDPTIQKVIETAKQDSLEAIKENNLVDNTNTDPNSARQIESSSTPITGNAFTPNVSFRGGAIKTYPINMSDDQDCIEFSVFKYKRDITSGITRLGAFESTGGGKIEQGYQSVGSELVYLPITKISDTNSVNWQEDQLNEFQRYLANVSLNAMQPDEGGKGALEEALGSAKDLFSFATTDAFGNYVRSYLAGQAVQANNLLTRTSGAILNPNMELLFNGPLLRQFSFAFDLIGKNEAEAKQIKEIIKFFKKNMAVRETNTAIGEAATGESDIKINEGNNVFLNSPYVFKVRYLTGSGGGANKTTHQSIGKMKMCALNSFTVDYTPLNSYMTFNDTDRTMFMYRLSMQFRELTPLYDTDYAGHPIGF